MCQACEVTTDVVPILRVADAGVAARWYARLGFTVEFEHRFEPHLPAYVGIRREASQIHLSEHQGDARPGTLVFVWVDDVDGIAAEFGVTADDAPWGREISLTDPDQNRLRIAQPVERSDVDALLGVGTAETLIALERSMWDTATRADRSWMDAHLTDDFTEFGYSGRAYTRAEILDGPVEAIEASLEILSIRAIGRDAALVTYTSDEPRGAANRTSLWRRADGRWRLSFHQGTPTG
jgi:hypothetical protein